jgi:serine/threonine protein kinase
LREDSGSSRADVDSVSSHSRFAHTADSWSMDVCHENIVHRDLRASNIIFHDDKKGATIIDFDLAGENGKKTYPKGFNTKINGARASLCVSEGMPLCSRMIGLQLVL